MPATLFQIMREMVDPDRKGVGDIAERTKYDGFRDTNDVYKGRRQFLVPSSSNQAQMQSLGISPDDTAAPHLSSVQPGVMGSFDQAAFVNQLATIGGDPNFLSRRILGIEGHPDDNSAKGLDNEIASKLMQFLARNPHARPSAR